jgi:hypothetical protein
MLHRRLTAGLVAAVAMALGGPASSALAQTADPVPSFSRCPISNSQVVTCLVIQGTNGYMKINSTTVPLGTSIRVDGGVAQDAAGVGTFIPPTSGTALVAQSVNVPGGLFGIPLPLGFDTVKATAKQAGPISMDFGTFDVTMPISIKLDNPLLGFGCTIGSSSSPIRLKLTTGTTAPPPPNTPISGAWGTYVQADAYTGEFKGSSRVDNAFSVPYATNCGYLTGILVTTLVNVKLGLPSAAGRNAASITDNMFLKAAADVRAGH